MEGEGKTEEGSSEILDRIREWKNKKMKGIRLDIDLN